MSPNPNTPIFRTCVAASAAAPPALSAPGNVGAAPPAVSPPNVTLVNPLGANSNLPTLIQSILGFVVNVGTDIVILMLVYVGFLFVTARGEPGKITTARQALLWTVVGALILLGAKVIALGITATVQALGTGG